MAEQPKNPEHPVPDTGSFETRLKKASSVPMVYGQRAMLAATIGGAVVAFGSLILIRAKGGMTFDNQVVGFGLMLDIYLPLFALVLGFFKSRRSAPGKVNYSTSREAFYFMSITLIIGVTLPIVL